MVYFERIEVLSHYMGCVCAYYPENDRTKPDIIGICNGERFIEKLSEADVGTTYTRQCFPHLNGAPHGMVAWF